jgi:hypothetical protein
MPCAALVAYCDAGELRCDCGQPSCLRHGHLARPGDDPDCPWRWVTRGPAIEDLDLSAWREEST